MSSCVERKVRF